MSMGVEVRIQVKGGMSEGSGSKHEAMDIEEEERK